MKMSDKVDVINKNSNPVCEASSLNSSKTLPIGLEPEPTETATISPQSAPPPFPITTGERYQPVPAAPAAISNLGVQEAEAGSRKQGQAQKYLATPTVAPLETPPADAAATAAPELVKQIATMYQAAGVFEREAYILADKKPDAEYARRLIAQSLENWVKDRPAMIYFYGSRAEFASRRDASGTANSKACKGRGKGKRSTSSASKNKNYAYTDAGYQPEDYNTGPIDFSQYQTANDGPNQADYLDLNNFDNSGQELDQAEPPLTPTAPPPPRIWIKDGYIIRPVKVWESYSPSQIVPDPYTPAIATPSQSQSQGQATKGEQPKC